MQIASTGKPVAHMNEQRDCQRSPDVVTVVTKPHEIDVLGQGNLLRNHNERFENLPEDVKVILTCEKIRFISKVSPGQCFITIHVVPLERGCPVPSFVPHCLCE